MPKLWPVMQSKHYAKWMGAGMWYYPADLDTFRFFREKAFWLGVQSCVVIWVAIYLEKRTFIIGILLMPFPK